MPPAPSLLPRSTFTATAPSRGSWLLRLWDGFPQNDDERFLREAWDLADLERRLRRLEQGRAERFCALPRGM
jgi:hypothetical protein